MTIRIAINGLGRIGRCVLRAITEYNRDDIEVIAINGPAPIETHLHLLKYDSVHGTFPYVKKVGDELIDTGRGAMKLFHERDPLKLPWGELDVDVVLECTGRFKTKQEAEKHLEAGAKKVLISAPAKGVDSTIVYGVNNKDLKPEHKIVSVGSCTTNGLAPIVKVLNETVGIERGFMTTIHAFTNDQNVLDGTHKDLRRARTASSSIIPTSTGAAKAIGEVMPEMAGRLDGVALRVPTPNVSLVDLAFDSVNKTTVEEINEIVTKAASSSMKGVIGVNSEPLVSIDFNHNPNSTVFDLDGTKVVDGTLCRIASWYDNEWGFSVRMLDVTALMG